jgi:hypothetical protein
VSISLPAIFGRRPKPVEVQKEPSFTFKEVNELLEMAEAGPMPLRLATNGKTSYSATGSEKPPPVATTALGSGRGGVIPDRVPAFASRAQAVRQFEFMTNDDAAVDVSLRMTKMPILAADFFVEAGDDTPLGKIVQEFVQYNLFDGLTCSWLSLMEDMLRAFDYGVAVAEKWYENRIWAPNSTGANRKQYTMLKDISARPTPTIGAFRYDDNGYVIEMDQSAVRADNTSETVTIDADQLLVFTINRKGGNVEGKSILRTAYKHWFYKNQLYSIDGIQKERHGMGYPIVDLPQGFTQDDKNAAMELLRNIRTNEEAGAAMPPGFVLHFADLSGQPVNVMTSIDHHNGMIMLNIFGAFALVGVSDIGGFGRGSSASSQDIFTKTLRYIGNLICELFNKQVIKQLVDYNFEVNGIYPKLGIRNIGETKDLQQLSSAIANLLSQNGITMDYDTEQYFRQIFDFPKKSGGVQTPENNVSSQRGNVQSGDGGQSGNIPLGTNPPKPQ